MRVHLLFPDRDFDAARPDPWNAGALVDDLHLEPIIAAMAEGDAVRSTVVRAALLSGPGLDARTIRWRQDVLRDCLANPDVVRSLYVLATRAVQEERKHYLGSVLASHPGTLLHRSVGLIEALLSMLAELAATARAERHHFASEGWRGLFAAIESDLDDTFFKDAKRFLDVLRFRRGTGFSVRLGPGNGFRAFVLRRPPAKPRGWMSRLLAPEAKTLRFTLHPRDEAGARALSALRDRAIAGAAAALNRCAVHVQGFFLALRTELAFCVGALALHARLAGKGEPVVFPDIAGKVRLAFRGLYDAALSLSQEGRVVGNDADACERPFLVVTGANSGGKSTFLRSLGIARLLLQCGLFVPAEAFAGGLHDRVFTHFRREEDKALESGKFEEELRRMSEIVDHITPQSLLLSNESFSATSESEGAVIAAGVFDTLAAHGVRVVIVTHLASLAQHYWEERRAETLFLCAGREADGTRTFRLAEGEPLATAFGADLYREVFGAQPEPAETPAWT